MTPKPSPSSSRADGDTLHEASQIVPRAIVRNNGNTVRLIPVRFAISDGYSNTQSISLAPGAEDTVDFALWTVSPGIQFQMKCSTRLDNDVVPDNDWQTATVLVGNSDCGCADVLAPAGTIEPGTDVTPSARIFSRAWDDEELEVQLVIRDAGGNAVYDETETAIVLAQGETLDHAFVQHWTANPAGSYTVQAWVKNIAGDHNQANDTASGACEVMHVESPDAGVTRIVFPTGVLDTGTAVSPIAVVRNFGPTSLSFRAWFRILDEGGSAVYSNNYLVSALPSGDSLALQFDEWLRPHAVGSYSTRCSTFVAGDVNTTNDTLGGLFSVVAAARDVGALGVIAPTGDCGHERGNRTFGEGPEQQQRRADV